MEDVVEFDAHSTETKSLLAQLAPSLTSVRVAPEVVDGDQVESAADYQGSCCVASRASKRPRRGGNREGSDTCTKLWIARTYMRMKSMRGCVA